MAKSPPLGDTFFVKKVAQDPFELVKPTPDNSLLTSEEKRLNAEAALEAMPYITERNQSDCLLIEVQSMILPAQIHSFHLMIYK